MDPLERGEASPAATGTLVVIHEDRPSARVGVELAVLSVRRNSPGVDILVSWPGIDAGLAHWLRARGVAVLDEPAFADRGWNIKPTLLGVGLDRGAREVVWLDTDIIAAGDIRPLLAGCGADEVVVSDEHYWGISHGGTVRTELWGLAVGRTLTATANSGFVRVTGAHRGLLAAWRALLDCPQYAAVQRRAWETRPVHMVGDQDVLTALLGSRRFAHLPVRYLRRGRDIALNFGPAGYSVAERLGNLGRGLPPLVHCSGPKPWETPAVTSVGGGLRAWYRRAFLEVCEYTAVARAYRDEIDGSALALDVRTGLGRLCRVLGGGQPNLQSLPLAVFHGALRRVKRAFVGTSWPTDPARIPAADRPDGEAIVARALAAIDGHAARETAA
ncbi:MAG: nucleotide-diphospho-sugar transferase [Ectothiorhodospiraceae bacterium]|nr:nucleotide-diphospho-sugar transferase [Chromatiales bacterium]MCP5155955.1 nucleotide-diphospho-sugar transferase [Ectothiorhodospiraceae bacterium]